MELPHFTVFWRRVLRDSGKGQIGIALFWLVATILTSVAANQSFGAELLHGFELIFVYVTFFIGHFLLYRVIATTMRLAVDEAKGGAMGWFTSTIGTGKALLGTLAAAGMLAIVPYLGLVLYQPTAFYAHDLEFLEGPVQLMPILGEYISFNMHFILGLIAFALACVALQLAFRGFKYRWFLPDAIALAGALVIFWDSQGLYGEQSLNGEPGQPAGYLLIGSFLLVSLMLAAIYGAIIRPTIMLRSIVATLLIGVPLILGVIGGVSMLDISISPLKSVTSILNSRELAPIHAALSVFYPGLKTAWANELWDRGQVIYTCVFMGSNWRFANWLVIPVKFALVLVLWEFTCGQLHRSRSADATT